MLEPSGPREWGDYDMIVLREGADSAVEAWDRASERAQVEGKHCGVVGEAEAAELSCGWRGGWDDVVQAGSLGRPLPGLARARLACTSP